MGKTDYTLEVLLQQNISKNTRALLKILLANEGKLILQDDIVNKIWGEIPMDKGMKRLRVSLNLARSFLKSIGLDERYEIKTIIGYAYSIIDHNITQEERQKIFKQSNTKDQADYITILCEFRHHDIYVFKALYLNTKQVVSKKHLTELLQDISVQEDSVVESVHRINKQLKIYYPQLQISYVPKIGYVLIDTLES